MLSKVVCRKKSRTNVFKRDICVVPTVFPFRSEHAPNRLRWYRKAVKGLDDNYKSWYIASSWAAKPFAIVPDCTLWSMCECAYRYAASHPIRQHTWAPLLILTYIYYMWKKHCERKPYIYILIYVCFAVWVIPGTDPRKTCLSTPIESLNCLELVSIFFYQRGKKVYI